jgi:hypothetical protein
MNVSHIHQHWELETNSISNNAYFENAPLLRALIYVEHAKKILMIPIDPLGIIG